MTRPRLSLIAAVADNGVIGGGEKLPWRLSSDMKRFRALTLGKPVVMGRKTFQSIGKPLAGRRNIVVTHRQDYAPDGVMVTHSVDAALLLAAEGDTDEIMVIGGGEIYTETIGRADRLYITHVSAMPDGETRFPPIDPAAWRAGPEEQVPAGEKDSAATRFVIYDRVARDTLG